MNVRSRLKKLESRRPTSGGYVITRQSIDTTHRFLEEVTGETFPVSYEDVGKPLVFELPEETERWIDEILGRNTQG